jgi:hypothetical protein
MSRPFVVPYEVAEYDTWDVAKQLNGGGRAAFADVKNTLRKEIK